MCRMCDISAEITKYQSELVARIGWVELCLAWDLFEEAQKHQDRCQEVMGCIFRLFREKQGLMDRVQMADSDDEIDQILNQPQPVKGHTH